MKYMKYRATIAAWFSSFFENALFSLVNRRIDIRSFKLTHYPDPRHISTSYAERLNWSLRTSMRPYTRLSNGFSRKLRNHEAAVALNYFAYNFVRIHRTLRTSSMAACVRTKLWDVSDIVGLFEAREAQRAA